MTNVSPPFLDGNEEDRVKKLQHYPAHSVIDFDKGKKLSIIYAPEEIIRENYPRIGGSALTWPEVRKTGKEVILGLKGQQLLDMNAIDQLVDYLEYWLTITAPSTMSQITVIIFSLTDLSYLSR